MADPQSVPCRFDMTPHETTRHRAETKHLHFIRKHISIISFLSGIKVNEDALYFSSNMIITIIPIC